MIIYALGDIYNFDNMSVVEIDKQNKKRVLFQFAVGHVKFAEFATEEKASFYVKRMADAYENGDRVFK